jgi:hypothetical protein
VGEWNSRSLHYAPPDFLLDLVALSHFMRPSLRKGAHAGLSRLRGRKSGFAPVGMTHSLNRIMAVSLG